MENKKCFYLVEGECEEKLLKALKGQPALIKPGSVKKFNVIQNEIPASKLMSFDPGSRVVFVFDTVFCKPFLQKGWIIFQFNML